MKQKHNEGFSLVEVLVAMAILATILIGTGGALMTSYRINNKTDQLMQAQLAVSSKVEELMAKGAKAADEGTVDNVTVTLSDKGNYYEVVVSSGDVSVTTNIRKAGS